MAGMSLDTLAAQTQAEMDSLRQLDGMTHEPGFEPQQLGGESLDALGFTSLDDPSFTQSALGDINSGFTNSLEQQQQTAATPDYTDMALAATGKGLKATGVLLLEFVKSLTCRTVDDIGFFGVNFLKVGVGVVVLGILLILMAAASGWRGFGFSYLGGDVLFSGLGVLGVGGLLLWVASELKMRNPSVNAPTIEELPDVTDHDVDDYVANIEDSIENVVTDDLLSELDDILGSDTFDMMDIEEPIEEKREEIEAVLDIPDFDALDRQVASERRTMTRANLISTFLPYFMKKTPQFRESFEIAKGTSDYEALRVVVVKAVANLQNIPIEKVSQQVLSARETFFSYKIVFERVKKIKKVSELESELETYFRATIQDPKLSEEELRKQKLRIKATVEASADTWEITINKGTSGIITIGDCLVEGSRELEYFKNEKNALPIIAGITESGSVILEDAQYLDNMMITGKQRSGKSWECSSILTCLLTFNSPEDVALIVIDPKNSTLFNTLALFPHVIGLHGENDILAIFREILDIEAPRRAELLREARFETLKDYNKANPDKKLPRLYIVIDEVISVLDALKKKREGEKEAEGKARMKEFSSAMLTIMSKLPYIGIGLIFIPHRATGIIDKTARTLLKLKAAVMAEEDEIEETLGEKIDRRLTAPGDIALRAVSMESARFVRGSAVADEDTTQAETLRRIAKGFYSMGVEVPKWGHLPVSYVDNSETVQKELFGNTNRVQY